VVGHRGSNRRDLFNSIERGDFPRWTLFIQMMTDAQAKAFAFNPFDLTKVWPKAAFPLTEVVISSSTATPNDIMAAKPTTAFDDKSGKFVIDSQFFTELGHEGL
jgi:catalase